MFDKFMEALSLLLVAAVVVFASAGVIGLGVFWGISVAARHLP